MNKIYYGDTLTTYNECQEEFGGSTVALVYASHKRAGGGWKNHFKGQEEYIANYTNLVKRLKPFQYMYNKEAKWAGFTIHLKGVAGNDGKEYNFIVSPAPLRFLFKDDEIEAELERRIIDVCRISNQYDNLIAGPWGCGLFGNDYETVKRLFVKHVTNNMVLSEYINPDIGRMWGKGDQPKFNRRAKW